MNFPDVTHVEVTGLVGTLAVTVDAVATGITIRTAGRFERGVSFREPITAIVLPSLRRDSATGRVSLTVPPGTAITLIKCRGRLVHSSGLVRNLDGGVEEL